MIMELQAPPSVSDATKEKLGKAFLESLKTRDWEKMRDILTPEVIWTLPGTSLLSGPAAGVDAVLKRAKQLRDFGVMVELRHILIGWTGVGLALHNTASRGSLVLDEWVVIVCEITGDKISRISTYLSDVDGINAFFIEGVI